MAKEKSIIKRKIAHQKRRFHEETSKREMNKKVFVNPKSHEFSNSEKLEKFQMLQTLPRLLLKSLKSHY